MTAGGSADRSLRRRGPDAAADIRAVFCTAARDTSPLAGNPTLVERFEEPSALAQFSIRGLAGHLLRALTSVEGYLDLPEPKAGPGTGRDIITAAEYYATVLQIDPEIGSEAQQAIRRRGEAAASGPPDRFSQRWRESVERLSARLTSEPADRLVEVYGHLVLRLDDYLITRLIELVVHADDLAASLGTDPPPFNADASAVAIGTLVDVARVRHGDAAVLRALTRRERDAVAALRVI